MLSSLVFLVAASLGPGGLPNGGRCADSAVNVGYLYEKSNAKRVIEIDKVIPTDPRLLGYIIGYLAKTVDGSLYLEPRGGDYLSRAMLGPLDEVAGQTIDPGKAGRMVIPIRAVPTRAAVRLIPCVRWPKGLAYPAL